ncbi:Transposase and inactivated derivatives [Alloiococcus otitis]|uniref:Integrase catalytic domain-containing protein n=1 Tax=Alloiococcus otitis ATCC 51267 TaxID=883081 RepID=K9EE55_9LACT|nr:IS21 family transposase [Alloiococcus otitis]EKU93892.1 hypothetical protein HMPREF9698_00569 [Alloiococcus otitis ATCC 51267]EKU94171.1 hypothetical protein HMPREF9698_00203 [Alloiococcus otitis ATCC 51267]SUU81196.1 Transposase and inactivated derivatives [Alloiococcus otitis]SUU81692.1 Transposase and inactivated derivatives [Alloiococcus otitis]
MRRDIREGVKKYMIDGIKPNFSALAQQFGCDYRTVKAAYHEALKGESSTSPRKKRGSKLDPFKNMIHEKLEGHCSAYSIFRFIEKKGFDGSYSLVKTYCRELKKERVKKATIRVEHTPGLSAQVDWKENIHLISEQGEIICFNIFLYVLPFSKMKFITLTFDRKQDTLFQCLNEAFKHTGGVPEEIWFDNMKTVVDQSRTQFSKVQLNERFYAFSKDAGFRTMVCRPFRPQTKGSVEALARTVERLRVYNHEFHDSTDLIHIVDMLCHDLNREVSQATGETPYFLWKDKEKEHLHELPENLLTPYFNDSICRKVTKEAMVLFRKCRYSVDPRYIGKEVELALSDNESHVHIYYNGERIRSHLLTEKPLNYNYDDMVQILKSDVLSHKDEDDIQSYIENSLKQYDFLEEPTNE